MTVAAYGVPGKMRLVIGLLACLLFSCLAVCAQDDSSGQQYNPYLPPSDSQYQQSQPPYPSTDSTYQPSTNYQSPDTQYQPSQPTYQPPDSYTPPSDSGGISTQTDTTVPSDSGTYTPPATDATSSTTDSGSTTDSSSGSNTYEQSTTSDSSGSALWGIFCLIAFATFLWWITTLFGGAKSVAPATHNEQVYMLQREVVWSRLRDYFAEETPILTTNWHVATADANSGRMVCTLSWTVQEQIGTETYDQRVRRAFLEREHQSTLTPMTTRITLTLLVVPEANGTKLTYDWGVQHQGDVNSTIAPLTLMQVQQNVYARLAQRLA
jgi:hypothetical protein